MNNISRDLLQINNLNCKCMKINRSKSKIMKIGSDEKIKMQWKQRALERENKRIQYLDKIISNKNIMDEEINRVTRQMISD